jgi:protein gp37
MGQKTDISWTDATWSPLRARVKADAAEIARAKGYTSLVQIADKMAGHVGPHCERVSHGCDLCYSDTNNGRCLPANGTGLPFDRRSRDLVDSFVDEKILRWPLHWKKPRRIFVENQSDLFGEWIPTEQIDDVFCVMLLASQHSYQLLTKRPFEVLRYMKDPAALRSRLADRLMDPRFLYPNAWGDPRRMVLGNPSRAGVAEGLRKGWRSPLPEHIWVGVSAEDQKTWDERTALLEQIPAIVRFVSLEPQLSNVNCIEVLSRRNISWLVQGGESGRGARGFDLEWARDVKHDCFLTDTSYFLKQVGAQPYDGALTATGKSERLKLRDRKGGDLEEIEVGLRVREFPS